MRHNPALVAALGVDPEVRLRRTQRLFGGVLGAENKLQAGLRTMRWMGV